MLGTVKHAWMLAVLVVFSSFAAAQEKRPFVMPLVPAADWRQVEAHPIPLSALPTYGGELAVEKEYGVKALELRTYQLSKTKLQVLVEPTPDATSAYGLFLFYQTPAMTPVQGVDLAVGNAQQTLMARGTNFLRFLRGQAPNVSASDYQALLVFVGGSKLTPAELRALPPPMPRKDLVPGSEKYLLGLEAAKRVLPAFRTDLIGFDQGAEVQLGQYQSGKGTATLMSIYYPTPQIARNRFGALSSFLSVNQDHGPDSIYGKREGSFVFLVLNSGSEASASALMSQFQVTQGLSWDQKYTTERSFTLQLVHMILAILLLTAILIGGCVLAGLLFFLSRRFAAKFFPNSQWGHPDDDQLIRLNL